MLEVEGGQMGLDHPGGKPAASGGLAEVLLHPLKHPGVGVSRSGVFMEVCDAGPVYTEPQSVERHPSKAFVKHILFYPSLSQLRPSQHLQQQRDIQMDFKCFGLCIF